MSLVDFFKQRFYLLRSPSIRSFRTLALFYILVVLIVLFRYYSLQVVNHRRYLRNVNVFLNRRVPVPAPRGDILDRNGVPLAYDDLELTCVIDRAIFNKLSEDKRKKLLVALSQILRIPEEEIREKLRSSPFDIIVKRGLSQRETSLIVELQLAKYGVSVQPLYARRYPYKSVAHLVGYVGAPTEEEVKKGILPIETVGKVGLEKVYDDLLRGKLGEKVYIQDVSGNPVRLRSSKPPKKGETLRTTVDIRLQEFALKLMDSKWEELARRTGRKWGGAVILMKTDGSLLVALSYPVYDPNAFSRGISVEEYKKLLQPPYPLVNRVTMGLFPPASTFKIVTALAALQEGVITPDRIINCTGVFYLGNFGFACFNRAGHGPLKLREAIAYSCDYYFYKVGYELGWKRLVKWAKPLGVGEKTGIEIYEDPGLLPTPQWKKRTYNSEWVPGDTINMSIGQGMLLVTPLQVAVYTAAIATGYRVYPRLTFRRKVIRKPLGVDEENLKAIREGMRGAVKFGTARIVERILRGSGLKVKAAGKTGTCENYPSAYNPKGLNHTWFTGFAPYEHPEVIVTVFLEQSGGYGGEAAAEIAAKLLVEYFRLYH